MQHLRGRASKDTETASETIISSSSFINNLDSRSNPKAGSSITSQQLNNDSFDAQIEKMK